MKKLFTMLLLVFLIYGVNFSNETIKQKKIKELFEVMNVKETNEEMVKMIGDVNSSEFTEEQYKILEKEALLAMDYYTNQMMMLYDKYFTEKEINDMLSFYKTPSGKKSVMETPKLIKELLEDMMVNYYPVMIERISKEIEKDSKN